MARRPAREEIGELLIEFCVDGVALSAQSKNRSRLREWQGKVASRATMARAGTAMIDGSIEIRLSEFSEVRSRDRDNVAKPIQDAMQGILFPNDRQVSRLQSEWCDIDGRYRVRYISPILATALTIGREFVWVRVYRHRPRETLIP